MIQQNELIILLVGVGAALFIFLNRRRIVQIPQYRLLLVSYAALFVGWVFTIIEGFIWTDAMNIVEHACYMASSVASAVWCWIALVREDKVR